MARDKLNEMISYIKKSNHSNKNYLINYIKEDKIIIYNDNFCAVIRYIVDNNIICDINDSMDYCKKIYNFIVINPDNKEQTDLFLNMIKKYLITNTDFLNDKYKGLYLISNNKNNILYIIDRLEKIWESLEEGQCILPEKIDLEDYINKVVDTIIKLRIYYIDEDAYFSSIIDLLNKLQDKYTVDEIEEILNEKIEESKQLSGLYEVDEETLKKLSNENKELKKELDNSNKKLEEVNKEIETSKDELKNLLEEYKDLKKTINNLKNNQTIPNNDDVLIETKMIEKDNSSKDEISLEALPMYKTIENIKYLIEVFGKEKVIIHEEDFIDAVTKIYNYNKGIGCDRSTLYASYKRYKGIIDFNPKFKLYNASILYNYDDIYTEEEFSNMDEKMQSILDKLDYKPYYVKTSEFKHCVDSMYYSEKDNYIDNEIFDILYGKKIDLTLEEYLNFDKEFQSSIIDAYTYETALFKDFTVNKLLKKKRKELNKLEKQEIKLLENNKQIYVLPITQIKKILMEKNKNNNSYNINTFLSDTQIKKITKFYGINESYLEKISYLLGIETILITNYIFIQNIKKIYIMEYDSDIIHFKYGNRLEDWLITDKGFQFSRYIENYKELMDINPKFILEWEGIIKYNGILCTIYNSSVVARMSVEYQKVLSQFEDYIANFYKDSDLNDEEDIKDKEETFKAIVDVLYSINAIDNGIIFDSKLPDILKKSNISIEQYTFLSHDERSKLYKKYGYDPYMITDYEDEKPKQYKKGIGHSL